MYRAMAACALTRVSNWVRQIISILSVLKSAATNDPRGYWASLDHRIIVKFPLPDIDMMMPCWRSSAW